MSIDEGIVMCGRVLSYWRYFRRLLSASAAEPWGNFTCSQSSRGSTAKKATASWQQTGALVICSVILNLQFHVALSELGSLFSFVLEFFTWVPDFRSWVSENRIFSDKRQGAYLKFRLRGRALILCFNCHAIKNKKANQSIACLHVMSRRPCWWSRTKAFLSSGN